MNYVTIGKNIRRYRKQKNMSQETLAERAEVSTNYIGMIERGEKVPSLETFIKIVNTLEVSSDLLLVDILHCKYSIKSSLIEEKLEKVSAAEREKVYKIIDVMVDSSGKQ